MTREALNKLPDVAKEYCRINANILLNCRLCGNKRLVTEYKRNLRGYIECLRDMNVITHSEMNGLYFYYTDIQERIKKA